MQVDSVLCRAGLEDDEEQEEVDEVVEDEHEAVGWAEQFESDNLGEAALPPLDTGSEMEVSESFVSIHMELLYGIVRIRH